MLMRRSVFEEAGGFDESLAVAYNDVELCFRLYEAGLFNVQVNDAALIHHESLSRGADTSQEKQKRLNIEKQRLYEKHPALKNKDPFYSPNQIQSCLGNFSAYRSRLQYRLPLGLSRLHLSNCSIE